MKYRTIVADDPIVLLAKRMADSVRPEIRRARTQADYDQLLRAAGLLALALAKYIDGDAA